MPSATVRLAPAAGCVLFGQTGPVLELLRPV
jgi:hypothetical protein